MDMKKTMFLIMVIMLSFFITGCSMFVVEENSDEYTQLKRYYHQYLNNDFLFEDRFQTYINEVSLETSKASVRIRAEFSLQQNIIETKFGSGVIVKETDTYYYILTTVSNVYVSDFQLGRFQVTDYQGNSYTGILVHKDLDLELATIRINKNPNRLLKTMLLSTIKPLPNEPILLISYKGQIMNSMSMGFLIGYVKQNQIENIHTTIPSDLYGHGGAIINHSHELVGIQYQILSYSIAISLDTIEIYMNMLNQYIEE
jgi:S1-C subfamily serine protease